LHAPLFACIPHFFFGRRLLLDPGVVTPNRRSSLQTLFPRKWTLLMRPLLNSFQRVQYHVSPPRPGTPIPTSLACFLPTYLNSEVSLHLAFSNSSPPATPPFLPFPFSASVLCPTRTLLEVIRPLPPPPCSPPQTGICIGSSPATAWQRFYPVSFASQAFHFSKLAALNIPTPYMVLRTQAHSAPSPAFSFLTHVNMKGFAPFWSSAKVALTAFFKPIFFLF